MADLRTSEYSEKHVFDGVDFYATDVLQKYCSKNFHKIRWKTLLAEPYCNYIAGRQTATLFVAQTS